MSEKLSAKQVAEALGITTKTLSFWYMYERRCRSTQEVMPKLPEYEQSYERGARYWNKEDLDDLREFQCHIRRGRSGVMRSVNREYERNRGGKKNE